MTLEIKFHIKIKIGNSVKKTFNIILTFMILESVHKLSNLLLKSSVKLRGGYVSKVLTPIVEINSVSFI